MVASSSLVVPLLDLMEDMGKALDRVLVDPRQVASLVGDHLAVAEKHFEMTVDNEQTVFFQETEPVSR